MATLSLSLGLGSNYVSGSSVTAMPTDAISLWLKADAGVQTESYSYKSNIALSSAGQTTINGNYSPSSIPALNNDYTLDGPNNNRIQVRPNLSPVYRLYNVNNFVNGGPTYYDFTSSNGTTWSAGDGKRPVSITISGLTGASAIANQTYNTFEGSVDEGATQWYSYSSNYPTTGNGGVLIVYQNGTCNLFSINVSGTEQITNKVATGSNWGIGSFTIVSPGTGSPVGSGTIYPTGGVPTGVVTTSNANTDKVTSWVDQSSNGFNATGINNPILESDQKNGKPAIKISSFEDNGDGYDIVNRAFNLGNRPSIMGATGTTAFAVLYVDNVCNFSDANGPIFGNFGTTGEGGHYPYGQNCSVYDSFATENRKGPLTTSINIANAWSLYSVVSTTNDWRAYINGQLIHSNNTNIYSNAVRDANLVIGYHNQNGDHYLKGKIAEILVYSRVLTTLERQAVQTYLNTKYAIY